MVTWNGLRALTAAGALLGLCAAPAQAVTAKVEDGVVVVTAAAGEANDLSVWPSGDVIEVQDRAHLTVPGPGCSGPEPRNWGSVVVCTRTGSVRVELGDGSDYVVLGGSEGGTERFVVHGGAGSDTINQGAGDVQAFGGEGDDHLYTGAGTDELHGGPGNDQFRAGPGDDRIFGHAGYDTVWGQEGDDHIEGGDDTDWLYGDDDWGFGDDAGADTIHGGEGGDWLAGEGGPDVLHGGPGTDEARYTTHTAPVTVTLDGVGPDGAAGEGDVVGADIEGVVGGHGDDVLIGDGGPNRLVGSGGSDRLDGGQGADELVGDSGADRLFGGDGDDGLRGGLEGDLLDGGEGTDAYDGNEHDDTVEARDGRAEDVDCGTGTGDSAVLDADDRAIACETRRLPAGTESDPPPVPVVGSWGAPMTLAEPGRSVWASGVVVTPDGTAVASWSEDRSDDTFGIPIRVAIQRPGLAPEVADLDVAGSGSGAQLVVDGHGRVLASWVSSSGDVRVAERAPGEDFGAPETVGRAGYYPVLAANRRGDAAVVWYDGGRWSARVRPADGTWGPEVDVSPAVPPGDPWSWTAELTDRGDIAAMWLADTGASAPWPIRVAVRTAEGTPMPVRQLTALGYRYASFELGSDAAGTITAAWTEDRAPEAWDTRVRAASRPAGGVFGAPAGPTEAGTSHQSMQLGVAGDGRVTLAFTAGCDGVVHAGPGVDRLAQVRRFALDLCNGDVELAQSPGNRVVAGFSATFDHRVTAARSGDDPFGPVQDLREDCGHVTQLLLATDDDGRAAALGSGPGGLALQRLAPFAGDGRQACHAPRLYRPPGALDPATGGGGGGLPVAPQAPPIAGPVQPAVLGVRVLGRGLARRAILTLRCSVRCDVGANAALRRARRGRALASGAARRTTAAGTQRITLRLRPTRAGRKARAAAASRRRLTLRVGVSVKDARGAVLKRTLTRRLAR